MFLLQNEKKIELGSLKYDNKKCPWITLRLFLRAFCCLVWQCSSGPSWLYLLFDREHECEFGPKNWFVFVIVVIRLQYVSNIGTGALVANALQFSGNLLFDHRPHTTSNTGKTKSVSRIKQLDFVMKNWWTFEEGAALLLVRSKF